MKSIFYLSILLFSFLRAVSVFAADPDLISALRQQGEVFFCGEKVLLERYDVRENFEKELLIALWDRPQVILWIKRAPRFFPYLAKELKSTGLPEDLKYIVVAESAFRPHVGSPKGAMGFWQLIPETARRFGLKVDDYVDERRDLLLSTPAAIKYLQTLFDKLGSWTLAAAAFNMGEEGLTAEILEQRTKNYYDLYLSQETQRYVFRVIAAKLMMENPQRYGISLRPEELYYPIEFNIMTLNRSEEVPISLVAMAAGTTFKTVKELNSHLRGHYIQPGKQEIRLPRSTHFDFETRLNNLLTQYLQERQQRIYIVRSGDSLSSIASKFQVPVAALIIWNRIDMNKSIYPGERLVIYPRKIDDLDQQ
jgi:LysM repeat protein